MTPLTLHVMICGLGTQRWFMAPPPPAPFLFVCYLLYAPCERAMHKFGVAVRVRYSTKSSTST